MLERDPSEDESSNRMSTLQIHRLLQLLTPLQIAQLSDETGSTNPGKVLFSPQAWEHILGVSAAELSGLALNELEAIEQRLLFRRITMLFGWASEDSETGFGRICVWEVAF